MMIEEIKEDLKKVKKTFESQAPGEKKPLFILSALTLFSGRFGRCEPKKLIPAAVSVELLGLGVEKHYHKNQSGVRSQESGVEKPVTSHQSPVPPTLHPPSAWADCGGRARLRRASNSQTIKVKGRNEEDDMALIMGDYYYSKAIKLAAPLGEEVIKIGAEAVTEVVEGTLTENTTQRAALHEAACEVGSLLAKAPPSLKESLKKLGRELGILYLSR